MAGPRQIVEPPGFTPLPHGLLDAVQLSSPDGAHWQNGITYQTSCINDGGTTYDECIAVTGTGDVAEPSAKAVTTELQLRGATPFTVFTRFDCSPVGIDPQQIAEDALAQTETWQVERAFWTGLVDGKTLAFPHLAATAEVTDPQNSDIVLQPVASIPATGSHDIVCGLGILEGYLADCYNGVGVIHIPREVLPSLRNLVTEANGQIRTMNGNLIAVGSGYPGTGPSGEVPANACQQWIFATGAVTAYRSQVRVFRPNDSIDRSENTMQMIAERTYVIGWDCCQAAILVDTNEPV